MIDQLHLIGSYSHSPNVYTSLDISSIPPPRHAQAISKYQAPKSHGIHLNKVKYKALLPPLGPTYGCHGCHSPTSKLCSGGGVAVKRTQIQVSERFLVYRSVEYIAKHSSVRAVKKLDTKRDTSKGLREPRGWNSTVVQTCIFILFDIFLI